MIPRFRLFQFLSAEEHLDRRRFAVEISARAYALQRGRIVMEGQGQELLKSDHVREVYFGM